MRMHKQDVTIYDVAREAKVSMATVSRVVNGNNNVRKETRDRVLEVIKRLHYQPNAVAQGLASKRTTTVGLIVPDLTNLYFAELSKGIDDIALLYKYNIIITSIENRLMKEDQVIQSLLNKQVDGVIYMSNRLPASCRETAFSSSSHIAIRINHITSFLIPPIDWLFYIFGDQPNVSYFYCAFNSVSITIL